ncbi:LOW QUALITY PROTEIN: WASH complex subunit 2 [Seriola aureovittata]|uniref:LOW QUALITY PROTEIN: WASH complex subunit 2 n=1 Tax=Seriola aureovittata TaxID=2871759 RepID=UPI0024BE6828|nr:LOW QUALITY PROTEIN: WASH complex subunit 2 [Seriola aureovittata]
MSGLPEGMANGPSRNEDLEKDAQIWERPWTLEEMRQSSANWSLAADSGLFLFLQDFSQRMLSKTHEIEKQLDSLIRDTKATDSCLHSVFNDFLMLSNTQFIENRVYDEEVEETITKVDALEKQPEQEKTREQKEAELIPKMQEAVNYGLRVLESAFEHLDIKAGNSDSEDEEVTDRVEAILEPKDLYVDRPLPYLIGSQAFMEQDDVGLGDLSSDEMSVDSDRDSVIESEDGKEAVHSDEDFNQEEDEGHNNIKTKSSMLSYDDEDDDDEEEDEDSDIFGESDKDDDDDTKNTGPSSFADELAARIKGEPVNKPEGDRASLTSKKKSKSRKEPKPSKSQAAEDDSDDMFKPPKMDDDDFSPFGGKSGLFSGGKGLFDDDDEGDLFSEAPKPSVSEEKKAMNESTKSTAQTAESGKKIPAGAVSIFPDNSLFSSGKDSDSVGSKENGTPVPKTSAASKPVPTGVAVGGGGGLFDDDDEDDDFFSSKSLEKPDSAGKEKPKPKTAIDLFDEDDEDGDIFSDKYSTPTPAQSKEEVVEEQAKPPEKKMPAGAISVFGPGTKSLLSEGLKKRQPSTSEESEKSEENGPVLDVVKATVKQTQKPQTRGLFSDDEDTQVFPTIPKSQSKPEFTSQSKVSKAVSLFDDEEEEDLFASAAKSKPKPNQTKASTPQPINTVSSSLFSDDEDQWINSKSSATKSETKTGGMKPSASAPSSLPSAKTSQKSSLFDEDEDDEDLFAPTKESSQKKPQRVALLFEDEGDNDDEDKILFGIKPTVNTNTAAPAAKTSAVASQSSSQTQKSEEVTVSKTGAEDKLSQPEKPAVKTPEPLPPSVLPENSESKKKLAGAVSLFGGINVLDNKQTKNPLNEDDNDDSFLSKDSPQPNVKKEEKKEEKVKTKTVSLFEDEEEDESDWNDPIFTPSKPTSRNTLKPTEERPQAKSTGVFQDEELLFSQTQQKDNDPDVDLFATSGKAASSKLSSVKPAAQSLFADDDEDDLFSSTKPKAPPPKVAEKPSKPTDRALLARPESVSEIQKPAPSPVKPKESSSRIGKLQVNLMINPATLLPGAAPSMPGAVSVLPGIGPSSSSGVSSSSLSPSPATTPVGAHTDSEGGVSFDTPVQATTLQSAHKGRAKGSAHRRPQSRAARQQAVQRSVEDRDATLGEDIPGPNPGVSGLILPLPDKSNQMPASLTLPNSAVPTALPASSPSHPSLSEISPRPSVLTLPVSTNAGKKESSKDSLSTKVLPSSDEDDLFGSDSLFEAPSVTNTPSTRQNTKTTQPQASSVVGLKKDKDKSTFPSIFDDKTDDLFQKVKPRSTMKKAMASSFLEDDDDDEDIFGVSNSSTPSSTSSKEIKNSSSFSKQDMFQDEVATVPKVQKKHKEKSIDASLFDDNIDIFADLTDTLKPKQKSKTKGETKSIFDDDMDDIFSPSTVKPVAKTPHKSKKTPPPQEASTAADSSNIFDDPLNALGGN